MREIAAIEIHALVKELSGALDGSFFKKFYDLGDGNFKFALSKDRRNHILFVSLLKAFNETEFTEEAGSATQFAIAVRKRLDGTRLRSIKQHGTDRIIILEFEGRQAYKIVIEMFGKGNLVVVNRVGKAELVYRRTVQKEREVLPNREYKFPDSNGPSFEQLIASRLDKLLEEVLKSDEKAITALSNMAGIGPLYLEDALLHSGINPKEKASSAKGAHQKLKEALMSLFAAAGKPHPLVYLKDGQILDYSLTPILKYEGLETKEYQSLGSLLDSIYASERVKVKDDKRGKELEEARANIAKQVGAADRLKLDAENSARSAHVILSKMNDINHIIEYMRDNRRATVEELQGAFKGVKVKRIDLKAKTVTIELDE